MTVATRTHTCDRCGRRLRPGIDKYVYSTWTKSRYCADLNGCARRAKRKERSS